MADTLPNLEKERQNAEVQKLINDALKSVEPQEIKPEVKDEVVTFDQTLDNTKTLNPEIRRYVKSLPEQDKDKVLRYLDIFRQDPTPALEYINDLRRYGSTKEARKQGSAGLNNPTKFLNNIKNNPEIEDDVNRLTINLLQGDKGYDVSTRQDIIGQQRQREYEGTKKYKVQKGAAIALESSARNLARGVAAVYDAADGNSDVLTYLEDRWPEVDKSREGLEQLSEDLTQFGLSLVAGKKVVGLFGRVAGKMAPGFTTKVVSKLNKTRPVKDKTGKYVLDKYGQIKNTSTVAQKLAYWGIPAAIGYGVGEALLRGDENDKTILGDAFNVSQSLKVKNTKSLSGREKAVETLKNKLKFAADGTAFVGGLNLGFRAVAPVVKGTVKGIISPVFRGVGSYVLNPVSKVLASEKTGVPQAVRALQKGGAWATTSVGIPPLEKWQFFSVTAGPLKERIMGAADKFILKPLRTRGAFTPEAKDLMNSADDLVRKYQKTADFSLKELEKRVYKLLNIGFKDRLFSSSTNVAAKQYMDDVVLFLQKKITEKGLPEILRSPAKDIRKTIDDLTTKLKPYVKSDEIEKEFVDNFGKYLRNSYEIFRGSYKPKQNVINKAVDYFKGLIKNSDKQFKGTMTAEKEQLLSRLATQKVDEIIQVAQEGTSPAKRMNAITGIITPISNLIKKNQSIPVEIQKLLGKVEDPRSIILDTVSQQANLLAHLQVQRRLVEQGVKNGWLFKTPEDFAKLGIQKEAARSLVPVQIAKNRMNVDVSDIWTYKSGRNRLPYYTTPEMAAALNGEQLITDLLLKIPPYKAFLAGKVTSQLSKTVLSLMTQMRNVETATFFSFINGHIGRNASAVDAMRIAFQDVTGKGTVNPTVMKKKLEEYLQYGVFDNSVVAAEVEAVMKDIAMGKYKTTETLLKYLSQNPIFRKATEFYQAADNLWKAYGYEFTKSQLVPAIPVRGLVAKEARASGYRVPNNISDNQTITWQDLVTQQFKEVFKKTWDPKKLDGSLKTHSDAIREIAARYTRDVYPNYSMVPQIVKEWRRLPQGNFVAFQSEIIRNIYNILSYSTREMGSSNPYLRQIGTRRFLGFSSVLYGFAKGLTGISSQLSGIDEEFLIKYQRFFSPWYQKNAKLVALSPIAEDGSFLTLDWSKEQPFESATSAFQIFSREMFNPDDSNDAFFNRFFKAMIYNFDEKRNGALTQLFEPFLTPSILAEAIGDVTPKFLGGRGGETLEGKRLYDPVNDDNGVIFAKINSHLLQTINPTTFKQGGELLSSLDGEVNRAGDQYDTTEKVLKLFLGLGYKKENPKTSYTYIVSDLSERLRNVDSNARSKILDNTKLYKNPQNILVEFDRQQRNRYREMSRIKDFLDISEKMFTKRYIKQQFKDRQGFGSKTMNYLFRGKFRPTNLPTTRTTSPLKKSLKKLQETYPELTFKDIFPRGQLIQIRNKWKNAPLGLNDEELDKYFREKYGVKESEKLGMNTVDETTPVQRTSALPEINTPPLPEQAMPSPQVVGSRPQAPGVMQSGLTPSETALLSDEEKMIRLRQRGLA